MLTTIYLYGELGQKFGRKHRLAVSSPAEALRAIEANQPGLAAHLVEKGDLGVGYRVRVNRKPIKPELVGFNRANSTIQISPVVRGGKDKWATVILGVALVAISWGAGAGATGLFGSSIKALGAKAFLGIQGLTTAAFVGGLGISMAIGGISQLLSPTPKGPVFASDESRPSHIFTGPVNSVDQGGAVPLCYGQVIVGSKLASAGVYSEDLHAAQVGPEGEGSFTTDPEYPEVDTPATPTNLTARSLQTRQILRQVHVLSEGEVEGICDKDGNVLGTDDRNKGIFFDQTQVQGDSGALAFQHFSTAFRRGTADQEYLAGIPSAESTTSVDVQVTNGGDKIANGVVRTIPAGSHNAIRVSVLFPALYQFDDKGNRTGAAVHFGIHLKRSADSDWLEVVGSNPLPNGELDGLIQGIADQPSVRDFRIPLPGTGPWDVRLVRESVDSPDPTKVQTDLYWQSYTTIVDQKLTFRHTCVLGIEVDAERFSRAPNIATRLKGIKVKVPSNYDPATRNYSGAWDGKFAGADIELTSGYTAFGGTLAVSALSAGLPVNSPIEITVGNIVRRAYLLATASVGATSLSITPIPANISSGAIGYGFHLKWTNNPAWIYWDLSTHHRYGLGQYIADAALDRFALYTIARYCDGVDGSGNYVGVDTGIGDGSKEPRFTINTHIQGAVEAYKLLADISSAFRGMIYWGSGFITAVQDAPKLPRFTFTDANVIDGSFNFSDTAAKSRHTVAYVQWNDPDAFYAPKLEEVSDQDGIDDLGVRPTTVLAFGCTSRGLAKRAGRWLLFTERMEYEVATFRLDLNGARCAPGDIGRVAARFKTVNRMYGRIKAVGSGTLTLDAPAVIAAGTWTMWVAKTDGTEVELAITSTAGTHATLSVTGSLTGIVPNAVFVIRSSTLEPMLFRLLDVKELDTHQFEVTALRYIDGKHAAIEEGYDIDAPPTSDFPSADKPAPATDLDVVESAVDTPSGTQRFLSLTWAPSASRFVKSYFVEYRAPGGSWEVIDREATGLSSTPKLVTELGSHSFRIYARSMVGRLSEPATFDYELEEVSVPSAPSGLAITAQTDGFFLQWTNGDDATADKDLTVTEIQESLSASFTDPPVSPSPVVGTAPAEKGVIGSYHRGGVKTNLTRYYRIRNRNKSGGKSAWTSAVNATATVPTDGDDGDDGAPGPGLVYMGAYNSSTVYYRTANRQDVVSHGGNYYPAENAAKSGLNTWGTPGSSGDWGTAFTNFRAVATALLLAEDATILKTLVMGDGTSGAGIIRSGAASAFGTGAGFWMGYDGTTAKFRIGNPSGSYLSWDGSKVLAKFGSGSTTTLISDTEVIFGDPSGQNFKVYLASTYATFGSNNALFGDNADGGTMSLKAAGGSQMLGFDCNTIKLKFGNDSNAAWYRASSGRLKTDGELEVAGSILTSSAIKKASSDGWTPLLSDGDNNLSWKWDSGFFLKVDSSVFSIATTPV